MPKPIVLIAEELSPATIAELGSEFEIKEVDGTNRKEFLDALPEAQALLIRSATRFDAEAISLASNLKVVARAGVGLDNVDIKAATKAGIMVVNAPTSNIISAAELTVGHILSLARHIPQAHDSLSRGEWKRSSYNGIELYEKVVAIIGLGRIGALVAERLKGFGVRLVAFDPYISAARAQQLGVELLDLPDALSQADFLTIHMPKTPETVGMISRKELALMKQSAYVINVARGGLIDEQALSDAVTNGVIAGAAIDVFVKEPPNNDLDLLKLPQIIVTPHLGASTFEAQEKAGISVAKSVRNALAGELVADAVNVAGGAIDPYVRPGLPLTEKLGQVFATLAHAPIVSLDVEIRGEISSYQVDVIELAALKGIFSKIVSDNVSYVNAPVMAEQRDMKVRLLKTDQSSDFRNVITLRGALSDGKTISVSGTLVGNKQQEKIIEINGFDLELPIAENMILFSYKDRPGIVAKYGALLGYANINIAGLQVARKGDGGSALSVLSVDSIPEDKLLEELKNEIDADYLKLLTIDF